MKPFLLTEAALEEVRMGLESTEAADRSAFPAKLRGGGMTIARGIATIEVSGALIFDQSLLSQFIATILGGTLFADLQESLTKAAVDDSVKGILLKMSSPGGEVAGTEETARLIRSIQAEKPVVALVESYAASAAYWLASAATQIIGQGGTSSVGSIGVVGMIRDTKERDAKAGVKTYQIVSSQSPKKRPDMESDEGRAQIQAYIDGLAEQFIGAVAENRGVSRETVAEKFGQGDMLLAGAAQAVGMIDSVGTEADALAMLAQLASKHKPGARHAASGTGKGVASMEQAKQPEVDTAAVRAEARKIERERIAAILNSTEAEGREKLARHLALETDTESAAAISILKASPKAEEKKPGNGFADTMNKAGNPDVNAGGGSAATEQQEIDATVARILALQPKEEN